LSAVPSWGGGVLGTRGGVREGDGVDGARGFIDPNEDGGGGGGGGPADAMTVLEVRTLQKP